MHFSFFYNFYLIIISHQSFKNKQHETKISSNVLVNFKITYFYVKSCVCFFCITNKSKLKQTKMTYSKNVETIIIKIVQSKIEHPKDLGLLRLTIYEL